jgi:hypothetical protein
VRTYFCHRAEHKQREFLQLMRRGRLSLVVGLVFLAGCLILAQWIALEPHGTALEIVRESLSIVGWVAMWRPLEIYLYDWWPVRAERRNLQRLARMEVKVLVSGPSL